MMRVLWLLAFVAGATAATCQSSCATAYCNGAVLCTSNEYLTCLAACGVPVTTTAPSADGSVTVARNGNGPIPTNSPTNSPGVATTTIAQGPTDSPTTLAPAVPTTTIAPGATNSPTTLAPGVPTTTIAAGVTDSPTTTVDPGNGNGGTDSPNGATNSPTGLPTTVASTTPRITTTAATTTAATTTTATTTAATTTAAPTTTRITTQRATTLPPTTTRMATSHVAACPVFPNCECDTANGFSKHWFTDSTGCNFCGCKASVAPTGTCSCSGISVSVTFPSFIEPFCSCQTDCGINIQTTTTARATTTVTRKAATTAAATRLPNTRR
eukprot:m.13672 g.13672  ORF g.13672 m.13672 type:complete len:326 (-) comp2852_c0_seq2:96-1073(-)